MPPSAAVSTHALQASKAYENGTYSGEFLHGLKHGAGTYRYTSPSGTGRHETYVGRWLDGAKHGAGTYTYADGSVYDGSWLNDLRHGPGATMREAGGGTFRGEYRAGSRAQGRYVWPTAGGPHSTGATYDGEWQAGQPHGQGTLVNGQGTYTGGWRAGKKHGAGSFNAANGDTHAGEYRNDKKNGLGTWVCGTSGDKYVGEFNLDQRSGQGLLTKANGTVVHAGAFRNNEPDV
jgi:hypothetical protein